MGERVKVGSIPVDVQECIGILFLKIHAATCTIEEGEHKGEDFDICHTMGVGGMSLIVTILGKTYEADLRDLVSGIVDIHFEGSRRCVG